MQGIGLTEIETAKIALLLRTTDLSIATIAKRMSCSEGVVVKLNRKFQVRDYAGKRNRWTVKHV